MISLSVHTYLSMIFNKEIQKMKFMDTISDGAWNTIYSPWRSLSSSFDPVVTWMISDRFWWNSVAVVKPMGTSLAASAYNRVKVRVTPKLKSVAGYIIILAAD